MPTEQCRTCKWFKRNPEMDTDSEHGVCQRFPREMWKAIGSWCGEYENVEKEPKK
jgi:hypothetical protein